MRSETSRGWSTARCQRPAPPKFWMVSEEAIRLRTEELGRQLPHRSATEIRRLAEAEFRAAAGSPVGTLH